MVLPCAKVLSKMSEEQAAKLREVERDYEEVLNQNCMVLAEYFKEVLVNENGDAAAISPPSLVLKSAAEDGRGGVENRKEEMMKMSVLENGRYNVIMWYLLNLFCLPIPYYFQSNTESIKSWSILFSFSYQLII